MKVAVLNTSVPFIRGGAEHLADRLVGELAAGGHDVELVKVPLRWATPDEVADSMFAAASLRIPSADRVIVLKFPAYLLPHPNKVVWLLHQFRQVYDLRGTEWQDFASDDDYARLARAIRRADHVAFSEARFNLLHFPRLRDSDCSDSMDKPQRCCYLHTEIPMPSGSGNSDTICWRLGVSPRRRDRSC